MLRTKRFYHRLAWLLLAAMCSACWKNQPQSPDADALLTQCERDLDAPPPAVNGAQCGSLTVPVDAGNPALGEIEVYLKRWPAISAVKDADPVFVIAGGPGQSATYVSDSLSQAFFNLRKKRDIIFVDQRGTGDSAPMHCDDYSQDPLTVLHQDRQAQLLDDLRQCAQTHQTLAPYVTTPYAVADLEAVRQALGYDRINLWGGSYGTRVALEYARRHRQVVRSVVLDGAAPVAIALPFTMGESAGQALQAVAGQCMDSEACFSRYGNPVHNAEAIARQLSVAPVTVDIAHPLTGLPQTVVLDADKFAALIRMALYDRLASKVLPHLLASAAENDFRLLAKVVSQLLSSGDFSQLAMGMHFSVICTEDAQYPHPSEPKAFLQVDLSELMLQVCEFWPKGQLPADYYQSFEADVPALILSGQRDPVTPPAWGQSVADQLSQSTHIIAPGGHHGVTSQGCGSQLVTQFIRNLTLTEKEQACAENIQPFAPYLSAEKSQEAGETP
ncbi:alpha/beta hydrolase [Gilvimarinus sp. 1_MG-2023]|uniref:alpha/beta hydrolase n=1 Tax=Gilvimarinus sp. 1_MG-2023 TaxID=3062638 RepID=UPI0026E3D741|nr:alpha/beta hydrolase [Gilvimarinus sp. 1_MG-2023]MDO6748552.1 alpha/beta hydrolase [Gilvimarinus sp. 1_MG-2023]